MTSEQRDVIRLLLSGLASAEALGSTSEFRFQSAIPGLYSQLKSSGWPFKQVGGGAFGWKPGGSTDDGDQALCVVSSLIERGKFEPEDVSKRLVGWLDSSPPDVGGTTARTIGRLRRGVPWHRAGLEDFKLYPNNCANGSLMRNGVLPGICLGDDLNQLFRATVQHSIMTHAHPLAVLTCSCPILDYRGRVGRVGARTYLRSRQLAGRLLRRLEGVCGG